MVVALGGAGHFSGAFDDIFRVTRNVPEVRPPAPRDPLPGPTPAVPIADDVVARAQSDPETRDIICFAYGTFYDSQTATLGLPSPQEFVEAVIEQLAPPGSQISMRLKAQSLHDVLTAPGVDVAGVAEEIGC